MKISLPQLLLFMYVLYLDESGIDSTSSYFILAGLAVFEREIYWYAQDVDAIQKKYLPDISYPVEFHASALRQKDSDKVPEPFSRLTSEQRRNLVSDMYQIIRNRKGILFGVAIEKSWCVSEEPYERAVMPDWRHSKRFYVDNPRAGVIAAIC